MIGRIPYVARTSRQFVAARAFWLALALTPFALGGCQAKPEARHKELSVFAASSLTDAFQELEREFEAAHRNVDVRLVFAGSQVLRLQLEQGALADVFASADEHQLQALVVAGLARPPNTFARNELVLIVPAANPAAIANFAQLTRARRLVVGAPTVPIGSYTRQLWERARKQLGAEFVAQVTQRIVSEESNVRLVRAKVELGEADAAIVYRTDAAGGRKLRVMEIPRPLNPTANYPIATLTRAAQPALAQEFVAYVRSEAGQRVLARHGFVTVRE